VDKDEQRETEDARKQAEALRKDREKAAHAAAKEAARAERDREQARREAEKARRDREKAARAAEKEAERRRAEQDRGVREVEREADRAEREAEKAALDAALAAQRAARQVERARLRAQAVEEPVPDAEQGLPPGLALLWRPAPVGRRGPRPGLTLAGIAEAAVALADAEGLAAVSMARVAERVGVTTMALYRYVSSKDDLLALMMETALGDAVAAAERPAATDGDLPEAAGVPEWRTTLERWCHDQLALAELHPWAVQAPVTASLPGPARVAFLERGLRALDGTPLTWAERTAVVGHLSLHVLGESQVVAARAAAERSARVAAEVADGAVPAPPGDQPAHPALLDYASVLRAVVDPERHPVLSEAVAAGAFDDTSDQPGEGDDPDLALRMMLDGVAALVERARARSGRAAPAAPQDARG
jgi:AcrR family transcriptional regulator